MINWGNIAAFHSFSKIFLKKYFFQFWEKFFHPSFTHNFMLCGIFVPRQISNILYRGKAGFSFHFADFNEKYHIFMKLKLTKFMYKGFVIIWEIMFFVVIFPFLFVFGVGLNSRFWIFKQRKSKNPGQKNIVPHDNTRQSQK